MELELIRRYEPDGTNGELYMKVCNTIELPWLQNQRNISCIPEARYELKKQYFEKYGHHLVVADVPGRAGILIHPASVASRDLKGCIAPVTNIIGPGRGNLSRDANEKLKALVFEALARNEKVFITIKSKTK